MRGDTWPQISYCDLHLRQHRIRKTPLSLKTPTSPTGPTQIIQSRSTPQNAAGPPNPIPFDDAISKLAEAPSECEDLFDTFRLEFLEETRGIQVCVAQNILYNLWELKFNTTPRPPRRGSKKEDELEDQEQVKEMVRRGKQFKIAWQKLEIGMEGAVNAKQGLGRRGEG
ncbi:hypothetical protein K469DRAFT_12646 [Zopfia rhizophila CBS 207.26]|uniref:Uncharacterized protein n=1 Tax=Zopfia rhizophila CBS 207.26 TaxID=1314779 RepID=A0A6A6EW70_9PEZI|nr:hypothetical protein K469DRAFT_12646 [Zopfia rhizophila CBS 207.26]